jgi:TP901 family phage tail tape measure protein
MADRSVSIALVANVAGFVSGMKVSEQAVRSLGNEISKSAKKQQALRELGNAAGAMGAVAAIGVVAVVKAAASFESAMSRVAATGDDAKNNLDALHDAAIAAGAATKFSATEAADGITELLKAGVSAKDVLSGGLTGALNLAAAGELGVADAANIMATTLSQFSLPGAQASHVADLLAAAAGKAQGEVGDMAEALKYVGPVAAQMGVSIEETTGTIAELATQGILASQAGTSLRGMLTALTSPSKVAADEMKKLGINVYDAQGNFVGFQGIAGELQKSMSGLGNAERDEALGRIFGNQQITAARILYAGGAADVKKWTDAVNDNGFAAETAATKMDNLSGDLEQLRGSLETALITTGEGSQGPLRETVQLITNLVNAYNQLPGPIKNGAVALLTLVAALGLSAFAASRAVLAFQNFGKNLATFGVNIEGMSKRAIAARGGLLALAGALAVASAQTDGTASDILQLGAAMAAGFAFGPIIGGLTTVATLMQLAGAQSSKLAAHQSEVASAAQTVAQALDQQTGAITQNTQAAAIKYLADQQAFELADKVGVSYADVTKAALGNEDALKRVTAASRDYAEANGTVGLGIAGSLLQAITGSTGAIDEQRASIEASKTATGELGGAANSAVDPVNTLTRGVEDAAAAQSSSPPNWTPSTRGSRTGRLSATTSRPSTTRARRWRKTARRSTSTRRRAATTRAALDAIASSAVQHAQNMKDDNKTIEAQEGYSSRGRRRSSLRLPSRSG